MMCDLCGEPIDYCMGHGAIATWDTADLVVCDHCDGECTEIVVGLAGYETGPCVRCQATGMIPSSWTEVVR